MPVNVSLSVLGSCQTYKSTLLVKVTYTITLHIFEDIRNCFNASLITTAIF
jgi:hypothetical protein